MWNFMSRILVTLLIVATFSSHAHAHSRMRFRSNGGAGVRGRRDGETTGIGGYGRASSSALPALYSAPKLTTFESVRLEQEPMTTAPTPGPNSEDVEGAEQQGTTTEVASDAGAEESPAGLDQMMEDSTMEAITQSADQATESSSGSSAESEVSVDGTATGTTEVAAQAEQQSGRYLSPKNVGRQRDSYAENSIAVSEARAPAPSGGYYKSNGGDRYRNQYSDSSAAFSSYYSSQAQRSAAQRPIDQQQVENFNYQQYTQSQQNVNALPASSSQDGYGGQRSPRPSFDQIAAVEQSFYSTMPNSGYQNQNGNGNQGNGYQQQQQQHQYGPQQQQQQQYTPQPQQQSQVQLQPQFRYIAQQPEQFYPTPAVGPVQQYLPINPLIEGRQQQEPQSQQQQHVANIGGVTFSYPDPPPPGHIQHNIAEVVQQNIAEPQFQQQHNAVNGPSQYTATATLADYPVQNSKAGFSNSINVDSGDDSMDITFEGLNDNVVDAELLERVQQIIEEHEREQRAFLQRQRESGQGGYNSYVAPVQEMVGPNGLILESPKPSIHYEVDTRQPSYTGNEITPRGGYNSFSSSDEIAPQASPMRFSQQLQQHQAFGNGNGSPSRGPSQGRALQGKKIANLDVQPAILTQHFMESGTPSNLHRQTFTQRASSPPANGQQQQTYLPPRQEYSNSEPRPQSAAAPAPSYQESNHYQYQQRQQQPQVQSYAAQNANEYQYQQTQAQAPAQPDVQSPYVAQQQAQSQLYSGGHPQPARPAQTSQNSQPSFFAAGYSSQAQPQPQFQQQETQQNDDSSQRGGYTQQFRQEYSRPQPQVEVQPHGALQPQPQQAYPNYIHSGDTNSIESDVGSDGVDAGGYEAPPRPNIITKTIVIHEQPAPTYEGQYPAGISNRAIITADDLRGTGLGGITISMQQPQPQSRPETDSGNEQQQQQPQYIAIPQSQLSQYQYMTPMSQFAVGDDQQRPSMIYLPVYQQPEPQPQPQVQQQQQQEPVHVQMPKPVYGIPLAPALGPESIASLPPSTYGNPAYRQQPQPQHEPQQQQYSSSSNDNRPTYLPPQYSNSVDADSDNGQSASVQDSAAQQSIWDSSLRAIYRLPNQQSDEGSTSNAGTNDGGPTNTIPLVSQIVSLPNADSSPQSDNQQTNSGYGTRIGSSRANRRSIRRSFSHSHTVAVATAPVTGHRLVSVRTRSS